MRPKDDNPERVLVIEGGLLPADFVNQLGDQQLDGQQAADYEIPKGLHLRDELGRYWRIAQALWQAYAQQRERDDVDGRRLTASHWLLPLFRDVLGFRDLQANPSPVQIGERGFPISHQAWEGRVPVLWCRPEQDLDAADPAFGQAGRRRSPSGLLQEYLNAADQALWGIVCNGLTLRILRDNPSMTRPAYIQVDLVTLFEEERYPDFRSVWLLLHASRFAPRQGQAARCWLERWRAQGEAQGERLLEKLRDGVTEALQALGGGFLRHPRNQDLRGRIESGALSAQDFYQELLRLVYRLLFLLRAEARGLLHPRDSDERAVSRYRRGYSLDTLRRAARRRHRHEPRQHDLWLQLQQVFAGLARGQPALALPALGGLFADDQCPVLDGCLVDNAALLTAVKALTWHAGERSQVLVMTDYAGMDAEELGSVYEALLELVPRFRTAERPWRFGFVGLEDDEGTAGNARKLTGSYYTPEVLVQSLIDTALRPVIRERLAAAAHKREALLAIRVVDPACGSGHFLLAAARTLARELARLDALGDEPGPALYQRALREVVQHCVYGVDLNPMAVELCRAALWMEALEPGRPLTFLESHIQCGNALVGVFDPACLEAGIPEEAFKALEGDDKQVLKELRQRNRQAAKSLAVTLRMDVRHLALVDLLPEESLDEVELKRRRWRQALQSDEARRARLVQDLWTAAFFVPKDRAREGRVPTNAELKAALGGGVDPGLAEEVRSRAERHRFFHWRLAFAEVYEGGRRGFDVVLGNPPWEVTQFSDIEFFAARDPEIAALEGAKRKAAIERLRNTKAELWQVFEETRFALAATSNFFRSSKRFKLTAHGKLNLYPLFSELALSLIDEHGRAGIVVQTGIATDDSNKLFFQEIAESGRLVTLLDIENSKGLFKSVHRSFKFCLLTMGTCVKEAELLFYATTNDDINNPARRIHLTPEDFARINPNTRTTPTFRADEDARITRKIYERVPVFIREGDNPENPWNVTFKQGLFNMTSASHLFRTYPELAGQGGALAGNHFTANGARYLPLYEAKMVHHYDHRFATYEADGQTTRDMTADEKQNPDRLPLPRYWVEAWEVVLRTADAPRPVLDAIRKDDAEKLDDGLKHWFAGLFLQRGDDGQASRLLGKQATKKAGTGDLFAGEAQYSKEGLMALRLAQDSPMTDGELECWWRAYRRGGDLLGSMRDLLPERCPKYLLGWRDICRSTDTRTVIASVIPFCACGHKFLLMFPKPPNKQYIACLLADQDSLIHDFVARQKVGGTNLPYHVKKQITTLPPEAYTPADLTYIVPRVLELTCTSHDLADFARDLGHAGPPFGWDPDRRHRLKCELDAYYARLYGLTRDELRYILDPADVMGPDYPSVTFPTLQRREQAEFGEYRTRARVLAAFDELARAGRQPAPSLGTAN